MTFVHLRARSTYSLLGSLLQIPAIAKLAVADSMPAAGIVDTDNLFGALEASDKLASVGVQPITGTSIRIPGVGSIVLIARNEDGYRSLCKLSSEAHLRPAGGKGPSVALDTLASHANGLLALSGGPGGASTRDALIALAGIFPESLYVEIQRHGGRHPDERDLLRLAYTLKLPIVATHEILFAAPDDYEAHDALLAIGAGAYLSDDKRPRAHRDQYWKSQAEMKRIFSDLPEAIENTVEIAQLCAWRVTGRKPLLPHFSDNEGAELRRQAEEGLDDRLAIKGCAEGFREADYRARLAYECGVISQMGFPGYFLIVADFIGWAKANGIPVGPGRGSGAGSVVAWALRITDLDPLRFGLLFERFLNPERVSMPDFDIDFCQDRRGEVIEYVRQRWGADRVAQIITHGKLQARAVVRDVGRVLAMSNGYIDKLAKLIPNNPASPMTLTDALEIIPDLRQARSDDMADRLFDLAVRIEGAYRNAGTHAAGIVIGDRPLDELVPMYRDPDGTMPVTQYNMKQAEASGLVKFDFLGLKTLSVISRTLAHIKAIRGIDIDISRIPLDDMRAMALLAGGYTIGVFQLESNGMRAALEKLQPDRFEDIIAMVALYRPGPMDNIPAYIARKHGHEPIEYPHPMIAHLLEETYGVIIYQEQVIQIAQVLAGYSLGQADLLRRAMGKKLPAEMAQQRARFVEGAMKNGLAADEAESIFDLVDKFAGYGFNKSHAAAYALISYQTAWLKANYCEEFLAASMSYEMDDTDKLSLFAREARKSGVTVLPPSINESLPEFLPRPGSRGRIRYALAGIKGVGQKAAESIVAERANGEFRDISDFSRRADMRAMGGKRAVEMLASAGAFDEFGIGRETVFDAAPNIVASSKKEADDRNKGIMDLFGSLEVGGSRTLELPDARQWTDMERCQAEMGAIGFYLSGHPLDSHRKALDTSGVVRRPKLDRMTLPGSTSAGRLAAIVLGIKRKISKGGKPFAFVTLSDEIGQFEAIAFSRALDEYGGLLVAGNAIVANIKTERREESISYLVQGAKLL